MCLQYNLVRDYRVRVPAQAQRAAANDLAGGQRHQAVTVSAPNVQGCQGQCAAMSQATMCGVFVCAGSADDVLFLCVQDLLMMCCLCVQDLLMMCCVYVQDLLMMCCVFVCRIC